MFQFVLHPHTGEIRSKILVYWKGGLRDAKMYEHAKFYAVLSRKLVMSCICAIWWHFLTHFGTLCNFLAFLALFGSFGSFTLFCRKVDLSQFTHFFGPNYFCSILACVKKLYFCISGVIKHVEAPAINKVELLDLWKNGPHDNVE